MDQLAISVAAKQINTEITIGYNIEVHAYLLDLIILRRKRSSIIILLNQYYQNLFTKPPKLHNQQKMMINKVTILFGTFRNKNLDVIQHILTYLHEHFS